MTYNESVEEAQNQQPRTPEMHLEEMREKAIAEFNAVVATKPGRQQMKKFLNDKAMAYLGQSSSKTLTRAQRRLAARMVSNRIAKKVLAGEDIFNAGV